MKVPKHCVVFGEKIKLKAVKGLAAQGHYGVYTPAQKTILYDADLKKVDLESTITHELIHAIFDVLGFNLPIPEIVEEHYAESLSKCFTRIFKINFR